MVRFFSRVPDNGVQGIGGNGRPSRRWPVGSHHLETLHILPFHRVRLPLLQLCARCLIGISDKPEIVPVVESREPKSPDIRLDRLPAAEEEVVHCLPDAEKRVHSKHFDMRC